MYVWVFLFLGFVGGFYMRFLIEEIELFPFHSNTSPDVPRKSTFCTFYWNRSFMTCYPSSQSIFNSQYFVCLPIFHPYMRTICSLWIIKALNVHLSTIQYVSRYIFSLYNISSLIILHLIASPIITGTICELFSSTFIPELVKVFFVFDDP